MNCNYFYTQLPNFNEQNEIGYIYLALKKYIKFSIWLAIFVVIEYLRYTTYRHQQRCGILPGIALPELYCNQLLVHF